MQVKTNKELQEMLDRDFFGDLDEVLGNTPQEDLGIYQPDGSKACINWELAGQGYQILDTNKRRKRD